MGWGIAGADGVKRQIRRGEKIRCPEYAGTRDSNSSVPGEFTATIGKNGRNSGWETEANWGVEQKKG